MIRVTPHAALRAYNSFGVDAVCDALVEYEDVADLRAVFSPGGVLAPEGRAAWSVLSGGNNVLFTRDFHGVLLHPAGRHIRITSDDGVAVGVHATAAVEWDDLVAWCVARGLWGIENLSAIPGYVGAAPVQNIGAYGAEVADAVESVELFCVDNLSTMTLTAAHCGFGYRDSVFKGTLRGRVIITGVNFRLSRTPAPKLEYGALKQEVDRRGGAALENVRAAVIAIRDGKLPDPRTTGNAGSFFKNPVVAPAKAEALRAEYPSMPTYPDPDGGGVKLAAGWLIEQTGWKGRRMGRAGVHDAQALVLVNDGGATGAEIFALSQAVIAGVRERFGVELHREVNVF